jgi:hypothetical protein
MIGAGLGGLGLAMMAAFTPQHLQAMSEEQLKSFLEAVKSDAWLQEKLRKLQTLMPSLPSPKGLALRFQLRGSSALRPRFQKRRWRAWLVA